MRLLMATNLLVLGFMIYLGVTQFKTLDCFAHYGITVNDTCIIVD